MRTPFWMQDSVAQQALVENNAVGKLMSYVREDSCPHHDLIMMLLANLTAFDEGASALLQLNRGPLEGFNL